MQDTNDFDSVWSDTEDQHVGAGRIFVVTSSNASKRPTLPRVRCQFLRSPLQFPLIKLGPLGSPPVNANAKSRADRLAPAARACERSWCRLGLGKLFCKK